MKIFFSLIIIIASSFTFAQKEITLKKKYLGAYNGTIPSYQIDSGTDLIDINAQKISISIKVDSIMFEINKNLYQGTYKVLFEASKYYVLNCTIDNRQIGERVVVYKRGNKISRDGLYPQPSAMLAKD